MDVLYLRHTIIDKVRERYRIEIPRYDITYPPEGYGDLSLPCFKIGKHLKRSPDEISKELSSEDWGEAVENIIAVGPYLNFSLRYELGLLWALKVIENKGTLIDFERKNVKVLIEHTSANPTGPLHVGRARNPIIGDSISRIMRAYGYDVTTEYYVDDMGFQVATILWWCLKHGFPKEESAYEFVRIYQKANAEVEEKGLQRDVLEILRRYESGEFKEEVSRIVDCVMRDILSSLERLNIRFNSIVKESKFVFDGSTKRVLEELSKRGILRRDSTGALYVELEEVCPEIARGLQDTSMYLTRSDGTTLYALRDIAYHIDKGKRADIIINILGEDHKLEASFVQCMMRILGKKVPEVVFYSFVSLPEGRMSTRKGRVIYLDEILEEGILRAYQEVKKRRPEISDEEALKIAKKVGVGAVRYGIVKVQLEKPIVFKWEEALSLEGDSAPFIMYSYVRALGILNKSKEEWLSLEKPIIEDALEKKLMRQVLRFRDVVEEAALTRRPYLIAKYSYETASIFNNFYERCPVLSESDPLRRLTRLALVHVTATVLKDAFSLLGIEMPEKL